MNFAYVHEIYQGILENDLLEDRREYSIDDLMSSYSYPNGPIMQRREAQYLYQMIQNNFDPEVTPIEKVTPEAIKQYFEDTLFNNFDGWEPHEIPVVMAVIADIGRNFTYDHGPQKFKEEIKADPGGTVDYSVERKKS